MGSSVICKGEAVTRVLASGVDGAAHARRVMVSALGSPFLALDLHVQRVSCCAGHGQ